MKANIAKSKQTNKHISLNKEITNPRRLKIVNCIAFSSYVENADVKSNAPKKDKLVTRCHIY